MGEKNSAGVGLPTETVSTAPPDEAVEVIEVDGSDQTALEQRIYETIIKQRTMALSLTMAGAKTRDGLYTAFAYTATATAGLLVEVLRRQETDNARGLLERLDNEDATRENHAGTRQVL